MRKRLSVVTRNKKVVARVEKKQKDGWAELIAKRVHDYEHEAKSRLPSTFYGTKRPDRERWKPHDLKASQDDKKNDAQFGF